MSPPTLGPMSGFSCSSSESKILTVTYKPALLWLGSPSSLFDTRLTGQALCSNHNGLFQNLKLEKTLSTKLSKIIDLRSIFISIKFP